MNESKHTPEPWTLRQASSTEDTFDWYVQAHAEDDNRVVDICICFPISDDGQVGGECHNNARMIAAAPKLLDSLIALERGIRLWISEGVSHEALKAAQQAIAQATGKEST